MQRRTVLRACGVAVTLGLAGCGGNPDSDENGTNDGDGGADGDDAANTTTAGPPAMGQPDLTAGASDCLSEDGDASVTFGGGVDIEGTVSAPSPCHVPELDGVSYDQETDTLSLTVTAVEEDEEGAMCAGCIGGLEYTAAVPFQNGLPGTVTVTHDGTERTVAADVTR